MAALPGHGAAGGASDVRRLRTRSVARVCRWKAPRAGMAVACRELGLGGGMQGKRMDLIGVEDASQWPSDEPGSLWCLDGEHLGSRRLIFAEMTDLEARIDASRRMTRSAAILLLAVVLMTAAPWLLAGVGPTPPIVTAAGAVVLAGGSAWMLELWRRRRLLCQDLMAGRVECFRTGPSPRCLSRRLASAACEAGLSLDILPRSRSVFCIDGALQSAWVEVKLFRAVAPPVCPPLLGLPRAMAARLESPRAARRRRLTRPEVRELRNHIGRLRTPSWSLIGMTAVCGAALVAAVGAQRAGELAQWGWLAAGVAAPLSVATIVLHAAHWRGRMLARRLVCDCDDEWLVVLPLSAEAPPDSLEGHVEILPVSRTIWTAACRPGRWRLMRV